VYFWLIEIVDFECKMFFSVLLLCYAKCAACSVERSVHWTTENWNSWCIGMRLLLLL